MIPDQPQNPPTFQPGDLISIHENPPECPQGFMATLWHVTLALRVSLPGQTTLFPQRIGVLGYAENLEAARLFIPAGLSRLPRFHGDDPKIIEAWYLP